MAEERDRDELVIALSPPQIGALIAGIIALILIWRAVRRPGD